MPVPAGKRPRRTLSPETSPPPLPANDTFGKTMVRASISAADCGGALAS